MKKTIYFLILIILYSSCSENLQPIPPEITVSPDSIIEISIVKTADFKVEINSTEKLRKLQITSEPSVINIDTSFNQFTHNIELEFKFKIPEVLLNLITDSIITISFVAIDDYNKTEVKRQVKVIQGYPMIKEYQFKMEPQPNGNIFYSFSKDSLQNVSNYSNSIPELVYLKDNIFGNVICSPDANWIAEELISQISYNSNQMNTTNIQKIYTNWLDIDAQYLHELYVSNEYINGSQANGIGIITFKEGNIFAFQLINKIKGVARISSISLIDNSLIFDVKIQDKTNF